MPRPTPALEGKRFGKLVVNRKLQSSRGGSVLWECSCDCGNTYSATTRHLNRKNNTVRSCGCDQYRSGRRHAQWAGHGPISGHWWSSHVKHSANCKGRTGIDVSLTPKTAYELFEAQGSKCYFTGVDLVISNKSGSNTASLDRIDNTKGYHQDNVRWVHKTINMMKRTYSDEEFISWCKLVAGGACPIR